MSEKNEIVDIFNGEFKELYNAIWKDSKKFPEFIEIDRNKSRLYTLMRINPLSVMNVVGPYLTKYETNIRDNNVDELLDGRAFIGEVKTRTLDDEDTQIANMMFGVLKKIYTQVNNDRRSDYIDALNSLLDNYVDYAILDEE